MLALALIIRLRKARKSFCISMLALKLEAFLRAKNLSKIFKKYLDIF